MPRTMGSSPLRIVCDVGGTYARFACVGPKGELVAITRLKTADYPNFAEAIEAYVSRRSPGLAAAGASVVAALAAPLHPSSDEIALTNAPWTFSVAATRHELALAHLRILNDFEALALAVPHLRAQDLQRIGPERHRCYRATSAQKAVLGPGTGMGVAGLVRAPLAPFGDGRWIALRSEGGHARFAPHNEREWALVQASRSHRPVHEKQVVCVEDFLSGRGLPHLHRAVCAVDGLSYEPMTAEQITQEARRTTQGACRKVMQTFCDLLGAYAGDVALMLGATGGVFLSGGVLDACLQGPSPGASSRLPPLLDAHRFRQAFEAKGAYQPYLASIDTWYITAPHLALQGCAAEHSTLFLNT